VVKSGRLHQTGYVVKMGEMRIYIKKFGMFCVGPSSLEFDRCAYNSCVYYGNENN
jgi:hypothetical protein